jgi:peptide/nickel transport system substrate-binding protein
VKEVRKVDDLTVEIVTAGPNPILVDELTNWAIMSKSWAEKNNATVAADLTKNEESFATRNANGTGPFILKSREADVKTVLVPNPNWWDRPEHNITEANFFRIGNDATRIAALLSGQVDFVYTVPPQDMERIGRTPGLKLAQGPELRTIYLGMDVLRDELTESNVKGKNPLKDRRVRQAFYQAIDVEVMRTRVMRGQSNPTALMVGPGVNGFDAALNQRQSPYDPEAAKKLLADAGYPNGFEIGMDCPNDRYVNDEQICQAVAAMLARIGIKVNLNAQTRARFFAKINVPRFETPFYLIGWTPATYDVHNALLNLLHTRQLDRGRGMFNVGGYSNAAVDRLTDEIAAEINPQKRAALIEQVTRLVKEDYATIPLHQQTVVWAMKQSVDVKQYADNSFPLRLVQVK